MHCLKIKYIVFRKNEFSEQFRTIINNIKPTRIKIFASKKFSFGMCFEIYLFFFNENKLKLYPIKKTVIF